MLNRILNASLQILMLLTMNLLDMSWFHHFYVHHKEVQTDSNLITIMKNAQKSYLIKRKICQV